MSRYLAFNNELVCNYIICHEKSGIDIWGDFIKKNDINSISLWGIFISPQFNKSNKYIIRRIIFKINGKNKIKFDYSGNIYLFINDSLEMELKWNNIKNEYEPKAPSLIKLEEVNDAVKTFQKYKNLIRALELAIG